MAMAAVLYCISAEARRPFKTTFAETRSSWPDSLTASEGSCFGRFQVELLVEVPGMEPDVGGLPWGNDQISCWLLYNVRSEGGEAIDLVTPKAHNPDKVKYIQPDTKLNV